MGIFFIVAIPAIPYKLASSKLFLWLPQTSFLWSLFSVIKNNFAVHKAFHCYLG
jgi:hypothetical protein